ncbi:DegT/DnrJ/EryC1/StrS family aminotransferase [Candidatus Pelagibacter sp.]|nr:DegT/DnrJ/EryC1/StrS family aminotransferase [Candidatus Pelagibacter sp.]
MEPKKKFLYKILLPKKKKYIYPLLDKGLSKKDLNEGIKVLKSGNITMGSKTKTFENLFKKKLKTNYALMVNSGSSANLLATFASCNPLRANRFKQGDHALIQSLCWPTSLWPLVQTGLKINFIDVDPLTLNVVAEDLINKVTNKTKLILIINVLGLSPDIKKIRNFCKKKKIILIEDNCESLGAKYKNKYLGSFGDFGTFSFFYSHQITSGEGGMIVCKNKKDYEILKALRSHGWSRDENVTKKYPKLDPRYVFINSGFNLRPTDIQAAIGISQFKKLDKFKRIRSDNRNKIIKSLQKSSKWKNQFQFIKVPKDISPSYMVFPILLNSNYKNKKEKFINYIESKGLETRPVISGSFINQPSSKLFNLNKSKDKFQGAEEVQKLGFVIGLHTEKINKDKISFLKKTLLSIDDI